MIANDPYGIVTRGNELRAAYGDRRTHGKVAAPPPPPPGVLAATVNPFGRVKASEPRPERHQPFAFGRRRRPPADTALAEMIKTAGDICNDACGSARDRMMMRQSTMFLIYDRARVNMIDLALMYGYTDHTAARHSIRAVRDRINRALSADDEERRQARIMRIATQKHCLK